MMPNSDHHDELFYPTLTIMDDSYNIGSYGDGLSLRFNGSSDMKLLLASWCLAGHAVAQLVVYFGS